MEVVQKKMCTFTLLGKGSAPQAEVEYMTEVEFLQHAVDLAYIELAQKWELVQYFDIHSVSVQVRFITLPHHNLKKIISRQYTASSMYSALSMHVEEHEVVKTSGALHYGVHHVNIALSCKNPDNVNKMQ